MRRAHEIDAARIDDDQLRSLAQPLLHARSEHRMRVGRIGADHDDRRRYARPNRNPAFPPTCRRSCSGRSRSANGRRARRYRHCCCRRSARTSFCTRKVSSSVQRDEVMPPIEPRPYVAWMRLNSEATRPIASSQETSRHGSVIVLADHRLEDAFAVIGVTPGEAAFDAGVAAVRLAVLVRHHAHDLVAAHFRLERAADAAIGAGRDRRPFRLALLDHRLLDAASRSGRLARRRRRRRTRIR